MVNYLAVIVTTIIAYIIRMIWYSPVLFGKPWVKLTGVKNAKMTLWIFIGGIVSTFVLCYVLAFVIQSTGAQIFVDGALIGVLLWLGLVTTISLGRVIYEKMPWEIYWINVIHYLIVMFIVGGLLAVWQ